MNLIYFWESSQMFDLQHVFTHLNWQQLANKFQENLTFDKDQTDPNVLDQF